MRRGVLRFLSVCLLLLAALIAPVILNGYAELRQANASSSYNEIAEHYLRAAQRLPWRADLYELSGHAYFHAKEYARANDMYQIALEKDALSSAGWMAWGDVNYLNGNKPRALELWKQALEQVEFSNAIYLRLAQAAREDEDYAAAVQYLQDYLALEQDDALAHYQLGLLLTLSDTDEATAELNHASQLDGRFAPPAETLRAALSRASRAGTPAEKFVILGVGLGAVNEWTLARAAFESAVRADDTNAEAWAWLGEADQQNGRDGSAELDRALELNPNSSVVHGLRGLYFQQVGNYRAALTEYQIAASLEPQAPARFVSLGEAYAWTGDLIRALEAFQYAAALAPGDAAYWRALADFCGRQGIHLEDVGIPAAQRAVTLDGGAANLDTLGWLLLLDARYAEAERILSDALKADPQNASVHFHLGLLHLQTGDRAAAFENLIHARDLGSPDAEAVLKQNFP